MFKFTSAKLLENLSKVRENIAGRKMSARIRVSDDVDWWFYQEFGTATHFDEGGGEDDRIAPLPPTTAPNGYTIRARNGGELRLPITSHYPEEWVGASVHHPGVSPKAYIRRILPEIHKQSSEVIARALIDSGYNPEAVEDALVNVVMPFALTAITTSMAEMLNQAPDRDSPGRLGPDDPASAFEGSATIINSSAL